jgi:hypothetical protein
MNISTILSSGNWVFAHKTLIKKYDAVTAILVGYLCSQQEQFQNDWFYCTYEKIEDELGIKKTSAQRVLHQLVDDGILSVKREGLPCRTYYMINEKELQQCFENEQNPTKPPLERRQKTDDFMTSESVDSTNHKGAGATPTGVVENDPHYIFNKNINNKNIGANAPKTLKRSKKVLPKFYKDYSFFNKEFQEIWFDEFLPLKKRKKASLKETALIRQLNKIQTFSKGNDKIALQILTRSVDSGWSDFFELKTANNKTTITKNDPMPNLNYTVRRGSISEVFNKQQS